MQRWERLVPNKKVGFFSECFSQKNVRKKCKSLVMISSQKTSSGERKQWRISLQGSRHRALFGHRLEF